MQDTHESKKILIKYFSNHNIKFYYNNSYLPYSFSDLILGVSVEACELPLSFLVLVASAPILSFLPVLIVHNIKNIYFKTFINIIYI